MLGGWEASSERRMAGGEGGGKGGGVGQGELQSQTPRQSRRAARILSPLPTEGPRSMFYSGAPEALQE